MKPRILVIDDEGAIRDSLRMILEYEDYQFAGAATGQEGIAAVQRERPDVLCLQEIKAAPEVVPKSLCALEGYAYLWHGHKGYSGVGLHLLKETFGGAPAYSHPEFDHETRAAVPSVSIESVGGALRSVAGILEGRKLATTGAVWLMDSAL